MGRISGLLGNFRVWRYERRREILFAFIIFLVASFSFGLGYLVRREYTYPPIIIEKCSTSVPAL